jgi:hypothetical protein
MKCPWCNGTGEVENVSSSLGCIYPPQTYDWIVWEERGFDDIFYTHRNGPNIHTGLTITSFKTEQEAKDYCDKVNKKMDNQDYKIYKHWIVKLNTNDEAVFLDILAQNVIQLDKHNLMVDDIKIQYSEDILSVK